MKIRPWIAALGALSAALLGLWLARAPSITATDVEQSRLSQPAPIPTAESSLIQSFRAGHNGLSSIELIAVYYGGPDAPGGALTLRLWGPGTNLVAEATHQGFTHNAPLRLTFPPLPDSASQTYQLEISGLEASQTTVWAYHLDGYLDGDLHHGAQAVPGDLRFSTTYTYLWLDLLRDSAAALGRLASLAVPLWLVLFVPGLLLLDRLKPEAFNLSRWARWGGALALSLALLPLAWLWITTAGLAWSPAALGIVYAALGGIVAGRWLRHQARAVLRRQLRVRVAAWPGHQPVPVLFASPAQEPGLGWHDAAMGLVLLVSVVVRLLAVRDLALPAWVDSSHHAFVARLIDQSGRVPADSLPLLDAGAFTYHFGVHTVLVAFTWFSNLELADTMLVVGQVLNGLMPLVIYAGAAALLNERRAALLAALYVGLVSYFPAYYVTWGRYSQLVGLLVLAPALASVWALLKASARPPMTDQRPAAMPWRAAACAAFLAAGVLLAHYRVFMFFAGFAFIALLVHARIGRRAWLSLAAAGTAGGLLALPWLARLITAAVLPLVGPSNSLAASESYNSFPTAYFTSSLERGAFALAALFGVWGLLRRDKVVWGLLLWVGGVFALLNLGAATWLVNNNAWAISLFVPVAFLLGWGAHHLLRLAQRWLGAPPIQRRRRAVYVAAGVALVAAVAGLGTYTVVAGSQRQVAILNPVTVLATADDRAALDWVDANTPADAVFLINGWNWLGAGWTGSDGGAWVMPYTGRRALLPPVTYAFGGPAVSRGVHEVALQVAAIEDADAPATLHLLRAQGVTHVFIGARGGTLKPEMFASSPRYRLLYSNGAAWVFEVVNLAP